MRIRKVHTVAQIRRQQYLGRELKGQFQACRPELASENVQVGMPLAQDNRRGCVEWTYEM